MFILRTGLLAWAFLDLLALVSNYRLRNTTDSPALNPLDDPAYICCISTRPPCTVPLPALFEGARIRQPPFPHCPYPITETVIPNQAAWVTWGMLRTAVLVMCLTDKMFVVYRGTPMERNSRLVIVAAVLSAAAHYLKP